MKIISTKEYNKLKKTQSAYLDLLLKPLQGVFEKVTDDDLLRENGLLYAENERLNSIIKEVREYIGIDEELRKVCTNYDVNGIDILEILDKENNNESNRTFE